MANALGAHRTKKRDFEVCKLVLNKQMKTADTSLLHWSDWTCNGTLSYRQFYQRTKTGIFLFNSKPPSQQSQEGYQVIFNEITLPYGIRYQFTCPKCKKAARILYLKSSRFVCRQCSGVTYESTHSGDLDRLARMVKKQRFITFGKAVVDEYNLGPLDNSDWIPKPKRKHNIKFDRQLRELHAVEQKMKKQANQQFPEYEEWF